jgi:hypothetical protein
MQDETKVFFSWLGEKFGKLLDPQFIIGALILVAWVFSLMKPLNLLKNISFDDMTAAKEKTAVVLRAYP